MKSSARLIFFSVITMIMGLIWTSVWFELILPIFPLIKFIFLKSIISLFFIISFGLQIYRFTQFRKGDPNPRLVLITFVLFGYFIHLFCAAITKKIVFLFFEPGISESYVSLIFIALASLLNSIGIYSALKGPYLEKVTVSVPKNFSSLNGLRIIQISDLHLGPLIKEDYVEKIYQLIKDLNPHIIAYTGDIGDGDAQHFAKYLKPLSQVKSQLGSYYVTGNHENMWGPAEWIEQIKNFGIQPLMNTGVQLTQDLYLAGVPDVSTPASLPYGASSPAQASLGGNGYKILLAHQPKSCYEAEKAGFHLMLCGHTHNGQFFPFNYLVGFFNPYSKGLNLHLKMQVYVNSGTGFWGPPLRLGVRSEITLLELIPQS